MTKFISVLLTTLMLFGVTFAASADVGEFVVGAGPRHILWFNWFHSAATTGAWAAGNCLTPNESTHMDGVIVCGQAGTPNHGSSFMMWPYDVVVQLSYTNVVNMSAGENGCDFRLTADDGATAFASSTIMIPPVDATTMLAGESTTSPSFAIPAHTQVELQVADGTNCLSGTCACGLGQIKGYIALTGFIAG